MKKHDMCVSVPADALRAFDEEIESALYQIEGVLTTLTPSEDDTLSVDALCGVIAMMENRLAQLRQQKRRFFDQWLLRALHVRTKKPTPAMFCHRSKPG